MRTLQYAGLLMFALFIDAFQAILGWTAFAVGVGLQSLTPTVGGAAGAVGAALYCYNATAGVATTAKCAVSGAIAGALLSAFGIPFGTVLGFALEIVISITLGSGLILLLWMSGMLYRTTTTIGWLVEIMPGLDILPGWTFMVIVSILKKRAEDKKAELSDATKITTNILEGSMVAGAVRVTQNASVLQRNMLQTQQEINNSEPINPVRPQVQINLKNPAINRDIAPRKSLIALNDNTPQYVQKAA